MADTDRACRNLGGVGPVSKEDGQYFSGFCDGEACFAITKAGSGYRCDFVVRMRADDADLVLHLRNDIVGAGSVRWQAARTRPNPTAQWTIGSKSGCQRVADILTAFPLRGKKRRDFELWSEALCYWRSTDPSRTEQMGALRKELMAGRAFPPHLLDREPGAYSRSGSQCPFGGGSGEEASKTVHLIQSSSQTSTSRHSKTSARLTR